MLRVAPWGHKPRFSRLQEETHFRGKTSCSWSLCWLTPRSLISSSSLIQGVPSGGWGSQGPASRAKTSQSRREVNCNRKQLLVCQLTFWMNCGFLRCNKKRIFSPLPLRLIHQFFSSSLSYFLFIHCCPSKDTLRETRMRSYLLPSIRAKMEFLPWLLSPKPWQRPFYLGTGSQSSTALTKGEEAACVIVLSQRTLLWLRGFPALPLGYNSNLVDVLFTLMRLASQPYSVELLEGAECDEEILHWKMHLPSYKRPKKSGSCALSFKRTMPADFLRLTLTLWC